MSRDNLRRIRAGLAVAALQPCLMCGDAADGAGYFAPDDSQDYGARPGKQRLFFYWLCTSCLVGTTPEEREARFEGWRRAA